MKPPPRRPRLAQSLRNQDDPTWRLSALEEALLGPFEAELTRCVRAGAHPAEVLAALIVAFLRCSANAEAHLGPATTRAAYAVAHGFFERIYLQPEVV